MIHYKCDRCEFEKTIDFIARDYELGEGRTIPIFQRHVWCTTCKTITPAESLEESSTSKKMREESIERHKRDLQKAEFSHDFMEELLNKWIKELEEYEINISEWKQHRISMPHCLVCGNENIEIPEDEYSNISHIGCGGTLESKISIRTGGSSIVTPHKYSIDGEFLEIGSIQGRYVGDPISPLKLWWENET